MSSIPSGPLTSSLSLVGFVMSVQICLFRMMEMSMCSAWIHFHQRYVDPALFYVIAYGFVAAGAAPAPASTKNLISLPPCPDIWLWISASTDRFSLIFPGLSGVSTTVCF
jgi:hypothetical protein